MPIEGEKKEKLGPPKTAEDMIKRYLTFQYTGSAKDRQVRVDNALQDPMMQKYAEALLEASKREGLRTLTSTAKQLREALKNSADALGVPLSPYAKDNSWAMLGLAQQYYSFLHPDEDSPIEQDRRIDPFTGSEGAGLVIWNIIDKQLGWEARRAYIGKADRYRREWVVAAHAWKGKVDSGTGERFEDIRDMLRYKGDAQGNLTQEQLTQLGAELNVLANELPVPAEAEETPAEAPVAPVAPSAATEPPPADLALDGISQEDIANAIADAMRNSLRSVPNLGRRTSVPEVPPPRLHEPSHRSNTEHSSGANLRNAGALLLLGGYPFWKSATELAQTAWESVTGMFNVIKTLATKSWFSFKAWSEGVKVEAAHDKGHDDHGKGHDHGHDHSHDHAHGHDDHGHGDHGHDKKPWYKRWWEGLWGGGGESHDAHGGGHAAHAGAHH